MKFNIPTDKEIAEKALALINADLGFEYSLTGLADKLGITPHGLKRLFKNETGISFAVYNKQVRMEKAKELLTTTNNTLQMIGEALGYTEGNNFQYAFRRAVGCTPGEYRRKMQK